MSFTRRENMETIITIVVFLGYALMSISPLVIGDPEDVKRFFGD